MSLNIPGYARGDGGVMGGVVVVEVEVEEEDDEAERLGRVVGTVVGRGAAAAAQSACVRVHIFLIKVVVVSGVVSCCGGRTPRVPFLFRGGWNEWRSVCVWPEIKCPIS